MILERAHAVFSMLVARLNMGAIEVPLDIRMALMYDVAERFLGEHRDWIFVRWKAASPVMNNHFLS